MQLNSLIVREYIRDLVGVISLDELISNQRLIRLIIFVEAMILFDSREGRV